MPIFNHAIREKLSAKNMGIYEVHPNH